MKLHKFYQQEIDTENFNVRSTYLLDASTVKVNQNNSKLSFYNPSDLLSNNIKGKPTHLVFYTDTVQYTNINHTVPTNTRPHYSKVLPSNIDYDKLSPYFAFRAHEVIQNMLRQTTQLDKSIIYRPMRRHLKIWFQMLRHKD
jgi:hypothetical protein